MRVAVGQSRSSRWPRAKPPNRASDATKRLFMVVTTLIVSHHELDEVLLSLTYLSEAQCNVGLGLRSRGSIISGLERELVRGTDLDSERASLYRNSQCHKSQQAILASHQLRFPARSPNFSDRQGMAGWTSPAGKILPPANPSGRSLSPRESAQLVISP